MLLTFYLSKMERFPKYHLVNFKRGGKYSMILEERAQKLGIIQAN